MPVRTVIWPPSANPKVTAGLTWPPEMLAPTETATNRAKPWQIAMATSPSGSSAALDVNLSVKTKTKKDLRINVKVGKKKRQKLLTVMHPKLSLSHGYNLTNNNKSNNQTLILQ